MWQRSQRWLQSGWHRWWAYPFAIANTGLLGYVMTIGGAGQYFPVSLGLLFAVAVSAYVGGLWPGLLSTLIIAAPLVLMDYRQAITAPGTPLGTPGQLAWFPFVFGFMGCIVSVLFEALHRSRHASDAARRELAATLSNISDAIITTDALGRIQYLNRTATVLLRRNLPDIVGLPFESAVQIRDATNTAHALPLADWVRSAGHTVHLGNHQVLVQDDGTQLAIEATAAPVRDPAGQLLSVVVTLRDCTEQRQIETMLRERLALQARFERIATVVPGAVLEFRMFSTGLQQILYASPAFKEIFGVDPNLSSADATVLSAMVYPEDRPKIYRATMESIRELKTLDIEHRISTPHRGIRWVTLTAVPSPEAGDSTLWHGISMDVTERKRAEERLRASQLQLRAALDAGAMGVITINLDTGIVELDPAARRLWELDKVTDATLTLEHMISKLHPDFQRVARVRYDQIKQADPQSHEAEYHLVLQDGQERWLSYRGRVHRDELTGVLLGVGVVMDITQRRQVEAQRLHSQKLEALGVLAGGIAHDFNNLLLAIAGNAKLLLADLPDRDPARASVHEIDKAASRAADLVRRILSFSSVQELSQKGQPIVLRPVLDEVLGLARAVLPATVVVNASIPDVLPEILADGSQVHQALINLLTNAADATLAVGGGTIKLQVAAVDVDKSLLQPTPEVKRGRYVCIAVSDAGKGIDPAVLPRIFDPFFTTKASGRGTGLGLSIVHGIMKGIDGAVTVHSTPGQGATFTLYFPAQSAAPATAHPVAVPAPVHRAAHILYVDDEEALIFLMTRTLERMGHRVTACVSPEAALEKFMAGADDFDLVVSDMAMPGLSGIELAERMLAVRPQLPFIITSGFVDAADVERAHAVGVRQMIMKPNTVDELSVALTGILREQDELQTSR